MRAQIVVAAMALIGPATAPAAAQEQGQLAALLVAEEAPAPAPATTAVQPPAATITGIVTGLVELAGWFERFVDDAAVRALIQNAEDLDDRLAAVERDMATVRNDVGDIRENVAYIRGWIEGREAAAAASQEQP